MKKIILITITSILCIANSGASARIIDGVYADPAEFLPYDFSIERINRGYQNQIQKYRDAEKKTVSYQRERLRRLKEHNSDEQKRKLLKELNSLR